MTELTLFQSSQVPAHLRGMELSDTTKALLGGGGGGKRISIRGGTFRLVVGGKEVTRIDERYMDVIIVKSAPKISRQFYSKGFDPDAQAEAPDCWSNDGEKPDATCKNRQSDTCNGCKQNIAGSGRGESRACRYQQRLALLVADNMEAGVHQLVCPSTSIFGKEDGANRPLQAFARFLAAQTPPVDVGAVVTRMKFDTSVESPKLFFAPVRWLTPEEYEAAKEAAASPDAAQAVVMTAFQADTTTKPAPMELPGARPDAPVAEPDKAARTPRAKATPEAAKEAEPDAPEKRKPGPKADAAVPKKGADLASIVGEWDDSE